MAQDMGIVGCASGSAFPGGKPRLAAALDGASSGGKEAIFFIKRLPECCRRLGREDGFQEGTSA